MIQVLIHHHVEDYSRWKLTFDQERPRRKAAGCLYERLSCAEHDPKELFVYFEWDSSENARKFLSSKELRERMSKAGMIGKPDVSYAKEIETQLLRESSQAA